MKLLIHVNLSPRWAIPLAKIGVHATHWSTLGPGSAADKVIFAFAARNGYVILTNDLDFGTLLAATNATSPSLIQLRMYNVNSDVAGPTVMDTISKTAPQLDLGALVTIQEYRLRVASLPLGHSL